MKLAWIYLIYKQKIKFNKGQVYRDNTVAFECRQLEKDKLREIEIENQKPKSNLGRQR